MYEAHELTKQNISDFLPSYTYGMDDSEIKTFYNIVARLLQGQDFDEDSLYDLVKQYEDFIRDQMGFYNAFEVDDLEDAEYILSCTGVFDILDSSILADLESEGVDYIELVTYFEALCEANDIVGNIQPFEFLQDYFIYHNKQQIVDDILEWERS